MFWLTIGSKTVGSLGTSDPPVILDTQEIEIRRLEV
jgi:hypothetical protein